MALAKTTPSVGDKTIATGTTQNVQRKIFAIHVSKSVWWAGASQATPKRAEGGSVTLASTHFTSPDQI